MYLVLVTLITVKKQPPPPPPPPSPLSRVSAASPERQKQLDEERELLTKMRPHKRKLYLLQRQTVSSRVHRH